MEFCCTTDIRNTWPLNYSTDVSGSVMTWGIIPFQQCIGQYSPCRSKFFHTYSSLSRILMHSSFEMVADGKQHMVELLAIRKNFTLRVDGGTARSIINEGSRDYLRLTSPLYIGGIPPDPGAEAFNHFHLRNLTSFNG